MQKLSAKIIITPNWFMAQLILMHLYASVENTSCGKVTLLICWDQILSSFHLKLYLYKIFSRSLNCIEHTMIIMTSEKKNSTFQPNLFPAWLTIMTKVV